MAWEDLSNDEKVRWLGYVLTFIAVRVEEEKLTINIAKKQSTDKDEIRAYAVNMVNMTTDEQVEFLIDYYKKVKAR